MNIARIMSKVLNRPLMLDPATAEVVYSVLAEKNGAVPMLTEWKQPDRKANRLLSGDPVVDGYDLLYSLSGDTAVIPVVGETANRGAYVGASSGIVTYEGIAAQITAAANDPRVRSILLDIESPGGEAVGAMEMAAMVRRVNDTKPVYAFANGMAASAGYALASGASRIFTVPSGIVGSIGVVLLHMDVSEKLAAEGRKPTLIHAGAHKVDGNPFEPLSDAVKADLQAEVMQFYDLFVQTVAMGRKGMDAKAIRATEARTYIGQSAVDVGLADAVATFEDVMSEMKRAAGRSTVSKGVTMTDTTGAPAASNAGATQEQIKAAVDAATKRYSSVMSHPDIVGNATRSAAANELLETTTMSSDQIVGFVTKNVAATAAVPTIEQRAASADIDTKPKAKTPAAAINPTAIYAARAKARAEWTVN